MIRAIVLSVLLLASTAGATAYDRDAFRHWSDLDGDGQNTRAEVIIASEHQRVWVCPYTGQAFDTAKGMDVDHIVPLAWSWEHGADRWTDEKRERFANDPENLILVSADVNRAKGGSGPEEWLPPNARFVPTYVALFMGVCRKYGLDFDQGFYEAIIQGFIPMHNGIRIPEERP